MTPAIKRKWLKALRSGKYKQEIGKLYVRPYSDETGGHCCLGVLRHCLTGRNTGHKSETEFGMLADRWAKEMGLSMQTQEELAKRNDDGWSFARIATWIEKHL